MSMQPAANPGVGFANPVFASQSVFRAVMNALARPGSIQSLQAAVAGPATMPVGMAAIALALIDHDAPVWLDTSLVKSNEAAGWLKFHTGAPLVGDSAQCAFALVGDSEAMPRLDRFALGTDEYPDRSTTLIIEVASLTDGSALILSGPGIRGTTVCCPSGLPDDIAGQLTSNRALFPRGVDLVLVSGSQLLAILRSTHVAQQGA